MHEHVVMDSKPAHISFGKLDDDALVHDRAAAHCRIDGIRPDEECPPDAEGPDDKRGLARMRPLVIGPARRHLDLYVR